MLHEAYVLLVPLGLAVFIAVVWVCRLGVVKLRTPSFEALQEQRNRLHGCVIHWRYSDGTLVPQHKRQRMFKDLHRLSHKISKHPDNPDNVRR